MDAGAVRTSLKKLLSQGTIIDDGPALFRYSSDFAASGASPIAAVIPKDGDEVERVIRFCHEGGLRVLLRGAGTNLRGLAAPRHENTVVISFEQMRSVLRIDKENLLIDVQPGVSPLELFRICEENGMFFPLDPASQRDCTIGGSIATYARGLRRAKVSSARSVVNGVEMVLSDGSRCNFGSRTVKYASGYDISRFMVGSRGTIAAFTSLTLRLQPRQESGALAVGFFERLEDLLGCAQELMELPLEPTMLDFSVGDGNKPVFAAAREQWTPHRCALYMELLGVDEAVRSSLEGARRAFQNGRAFRSELSTNSGLALELLEMRRRITSDLAAKEGALVFENFLLGARNASETLQRMCDSMDLESSTLFGHLADLNFHAAFRFGKGISSEDLVASIESLGEMLAGGRGQMLYEAVLTGSRENGKPRHPRFAQGMLGTRSNEGLANVSNKLKEALDSRGIFPSP